MPWVNEEMCNGCRTCLTQCPVNAISMVESKARIDEQACIRCGTCHDACPRGAVRHDSERIPIEVAANIEWAQQLLRHFDTPAEKRGLIERVENYYKKEKKVAEKTLEKLRLLGEKL